jgi:pimeloyl-ACP methyl ester carboxylesterase
MLTAEPAHAEGARYAANLVFLPGLWAGPESWRAVASYLGHRGWEGMLLDLRGVPGGVEARGGAVAEFAATLPAPPVLVGHDAGALVALVAAARGPVLASVLLGPLVPATVAAHRLVRSPAARLALLLGRPVPPPGDSTLATWSAPPAARRALAPEPASLVRATMRGAPPPAPSQPTLTLVGDHDPMVPLPAARTFATSLGAELQVLEGAGHWPHAGPGWQQVVAIVHRWLVQRLGAPLLERYAEAMEERDAEGEDE